MHRTEVIAQETHAAQITFLRINTISLDRNKNAHRAQVYAFVSVMAMMAPSANVRIDVNFSSYRRCWSDFHEKLLIFLSWGCGTLHPYIFFIYSSFNYKLILFYFEKPVKNHHKKKDFIAFALTHRSLAVPAGFVSRADSQYKRYSR